MAVRFSMTISQVRHLSIKELTQVMVSSLFTISYSPIMKLVTAE